MKKNLFLAIALIGGMFLFATSCVKEKDVNEKYRPAGSQIVFSAATGYDNGVETRTEYTGDMKTVTGYSNQFERIDWVANDPLKIYYRRGNGSFTNAVYKITGTNTTSNEITKATAEADGTALYWGDGTGDHYFYGMYPSTGFGGNSSASLSNNRASGNIPAAQNITGTQKTLEGIAKYMPDMKYAYMVCYQEVAENSSTSSVELPFSPAVTAFEFRFKLADHGPVTVKSFKLSSASTDLTGNFAFDITGKDGNNRTTIGTVTKTSAGREITVSFGSGVQMNTTDILDFTVFALPVDQTGLTIQFTFAATETGASDYTRKLDLKHSGNWVTFDARKKYVITNTAIPGEVWDYFIEEIPDKVAYGHNPVLATDVFTYNVKSYKVKRGTTTKVAVPWHLEYQNGSNWGTTVPSPFTASTVQGSGVNNSTYATGESGYSTITTTATGSTTGDADNATRAALATATPRGTSSSYFDLSMHPCYGNKDATTSQNTANCYIVAAPGYYKFPLVYGNAIKNGAYNVISYAPESVTHIYQTNKSQADLVYQANFHNAINENITNPFILTDLGSYGAVSDLDIAIIWQDVPSTDLILPFDNPTFDDPNNPTYIQFNITPESIQQGNVIIALRGKVAGYLSTKEILWSWHIWVTEKDLDPITVQHAKNGTSEMAKYNLGWTDKTSASSTKYPDRVLDLKVVQDEKPATATTYKSELFNFTQYGDATFTPDNVGSNAFYQWGRKDPFLTATHENKNKTVSTQDYTVSSGDRQLVQEAISSSGDPDFGYGIRHPYLVLKNDYTTGWVGGAAHVGGTDAQRQNSSIAYNLWSAYVHGQQDKTDYGGSKAKTVYDPCPPGFEVPSKNAFMGFAGYTGSTEAPNQVVARKGTNGTDGFNFYRNGANGATIYLPYCGARGYDHTEIYDVTNTAYYWTDAPCVSTYPGPGGGSDHTGWRMSKLLYFFSSEGGGINAHYDLYKGAAYAIRPVLESVQRVNSDVTTGGMEGNTYDFNDGWTIN